MCIEGANLPLVEADKELNVAAMCFNSTCNRPPVCLSNVLNNKGDGGDCTKDVDGPSYDCTQHCQEYINVLEDYRDEMDFDTVDWDALSRLCNYDPRKLLTTPTTVLQYYVAAGLVAGAMPFLYGIVALICYVKSRKTGGTPFSRSVAVQTKFWVPVLLLFLFLAGFVAFVLLDFQPKQRCLRPVMTSGFAFPSSTCTITESKLVKLITGSNPNIAVPQDLCFAENRSYCEYFDNVPSGGTDPGGDTQTCAENSTQLCPVQGADGLCVTQAGSPYRNRSIRIQGKVRKYNLVILVLCVAIAVFAVPIVALSCWYGLENVVGRGGRIAITVLLSVLALCASFTYMLVQYLQPDKYREYGIGMGACGALDDYPTELIALSTPPGINLQHPPLTYTATSVGSSGAPVYSTIETDPNIPRYIYVPDKGSQFGMYSAPPTPSGGNQPAPAYVNDGRSPSLVQFSDSGPPSSVAEIQGAEGGKGDTDTHVLLHDHFIKGKDNYDNPYAFCGRLDKESSCGAGADCPCAPPVPSSPSALNSTIGLKSGGGRETVTGNQVCDTV